MITMTPSFSKLKVPFSKNVLGCFPFTRIRKGLEGRAFSNSSGLKSVFEKLRFRDELVWTVGLTVEIKLRFEIPPA